MSEVMTEETQELTLDELKEKAKYWMYFNSYDSTPNDVADSICGAIYELGIEAEQIEVDDETVFIEFYKKD